MKLNHTFIVTLKAFILLSPLPFGCVGKIFSPLFFLLLLIITFMGLKQPVEKSSLLYEKWLRRLFYSVVVVLALQVIPWPAFMLGILSPQTVAILSALSDRLPDSHAISLAPFETIVYGCWFLVFALFFFVMLQVKLSKRNIIALLNTMMVSATLQVIFGLLKYIQGNRYFFLFFYPYEGGHDLGYRLTGSLGNSNHFAFYLEMILPIGLALFFLKSRSFGRQWTLREKFLVLAYEDKSFMLYFPAVILMGVGIILTGSRAGVIVMILSLLIFGLFSGSLVTAAAVRQKLRLIFSLIIFGVLLIGVQETLLRLFKTNIEIENRFNTRWPDTLAMVSDFPLLGTGFGTFRYAYYLYDREPGDRWTTHAHNDYLEVFSEGGIIGGLLLLMLIGMTMFSFYRMWRQRRRPEVKILGLGITTSLLTAVIHSFGDFPLRIPANMFIFVLILVLGIKIAAYHKKKN